MSRRWCGFTTALAGCLLGMGAYAEVPTPNILRGKGLECVEPVDVMRKDHMQFLKHQRDDTVHRGIRTAKHSLIECLNCHTHKDQEGRFISINAPGQFCESCHAYASVKMDCFECHATKPRTPTVHPDRGGLGALRHE